MSDPQDCREFIYRIDANDRVVFCNAAWLAFARENDAPELQVGYVIGRSLWHFITNTETVQLYKLLLKKVRLSHAPLRLDYRCDSPTCRRFMQLEVTPLPRALVQFSSTIMREEQRSYVPLLDIHTSHDDNFVSMCSWCKRVQVERLGWVEVEMAIRALDLFNATLLPRLTHGMCDKCHTRIVAALD